MTDRIDYTKKPLTLTEQVARLKQRGLLFDDESEAIAYLFNISYYRLRAYTYPFQENGENSGHRCKDAVGCGAGSSKKTKGIGMVELVVFDIDGVLTDGSILVDSRGNEQKRISIKDIDAVYELKRMGFQLAAITGENSPIVAYFQRRFPWDYFFSGCKKK